jgi:hypothetical protein
VRGAQSTAGSGVPLRDQAFPELEYTFKHALTHEVTYRGLLHDRRRALHARITEAIAADSLDAPPGACPKCASARSIRNSTTSQQSVHRGYEVLRRCRLGHVRGGGGRPIVFSGAVPTVEHVRDVLLF